MNEDKPTDGQNLTAAELAANLAEVPQLPAWPEDIEIVCILTGGKRYQFDFGGRTWRIEMHPQMGPCMLKKNLDPVANVNYPAEFWIAVEHLQNMEPAKRQRCEI